MNSLTGTDVKSNVSYKIFSALIMMSNPMNLMPEAVSFVISNNVFDDVFIVNNIRKHESNFINYKTKKSVTIENE